MDDMLTSDRLELEIIRLRECMKTIIEQCAVIADPWPGFYPQEDATEADKAVIAVRIQIAAAIRALSLSSQGRGGAPSHQRSQGE